MSQILVTAATKAPNWSVASVTCAPQLLKKDGCFRESIQKNISQWKDHHLHGKTRLCRPCRSCRSHWRCRCRRQWLSQGTQSFLSGILSSFMLLVRINLQANRSIAVNRQVLVTLRYGREEDEVMGVKFSRELVLISEQVVPPKNKDIKLSTLQVVSLCNPTSSL